MAAAKLATLKQGQKANTAIAPASLWRQHNADRMIAKGKAGRYEERNELFE